MGGKLKHTNKAYKRACKTQKGPVWESELFTASAINKKPIKAGKKGHANPPVAHTYHDTTPVAPFQHGQFLAVISLFFSQSFIIDLQGMMLLVFMQPLCAQTEEMGGTLPEF